MKQIWAVFVGGLMAGSAFGQVGEIDLGEAAPVPDESCAPAVPCRRSCWHLELNIPRQPVRAWMASSHFIQVSKEFWSYCPPKSGCCACLPRPVPCCTPPLYTFFLCPDCCGTANGCCDGGAMPGGEVSTDFARATATAPAVAASPDRSRPWMRAVLGVWGGTARPSGNAAVIPAGAEFASMPASAPRR
jgi:hypothetical protein